MTAAGGSPSHWVGLSLRPPDHFDFENTGSWTTWLSLFEDYAFASGLSNAPGDIQVRSLLYCMGPEARPLLSTFRIDDATNYSKVVEAFTAHFVHPVNEVYESAQFHRRVQQLGETVDSYYAELCKLCKRCNYASVEVEERLIRDRFIVGLRDARLADQLCRNAKLSLKEAWIQARQAEDADKQRDTLCRRATESVPVVIDAARSGHPRQNPRDRGPGNRPVRSQRPKGSNGSNCDYCGRAPHARSECPARNSLCNFCRKKGHFADVCRSRRRRNKMDALQLHAIKNSAQANFAEVTVNDYTEVFKIDSGAEVTTVSETFPGLPRTLDKVDNVLSGPGQQPLQVLGSFAATLLWRGRSTQQRLYVVKSLSVPLLGLPAIQALGVIKFVDKVSSQPRTTLFDGLGTLSTEYKIHLKPDAVPFSLSVPRRIPIPMLEVVPTELEKLQQEGVIRKVDSPTEWCSGLVVVPKATGGHRLCVDLTKLNQVVMRERHDLPTVDQVLGLLGDSTVFSKLDAASGFYQVKLAEESQELTTFITPFGRYCFRRMPFGITSAPEFFQKQMSRILEGLEGTVCMMDDILVFGRTAEEHDFRLQEVLKRLSRAGITLNK
ncbi:uncharacterized protein K02A2.6-like [Ornithodoros turicata]|uniref:uncharacterized protein K02A2.6-like n=1 Tax=Ornithodoros turicata TaxID=34597 RepID=UPI003139FB00